MTRSSRRGRSMTLIPSMPWLRPYVPGDIHSAHLPLSLAEWRSLGSSTRSPAYCCIIARGDPR